MSIAAKKVSVELFSGVVGLIKNEATRPVKVRVKTWDTYKESVLKSRLRGIAYEKNNNIVLCELGSASNPESTNYAIIWRQGARLYAVDFSKAYFRNTPTWHLAALLAAAKDAPWFEGVVTDVIQVYNADPIILGGLWQDQSNSECSGWVSFVPSTVTPSSTMKIVEPPAVVKSETKSSSAEETKISSKSKRTRKPKGDAMVEETSLSIVLTGETQEEQAVINFMRSEDFEESLIKEVIDVRRANADIFGSEFARKHIPESLKDANWVSFRGKQHLEDGLDAYFSDLPLGLEGPPAGGKDKYWRTLAWMVGHPLLVLPCNGGMNETQLEGTDILTVKEGMTVSGFRLGYAMTALQAGFIVMFDEVDALDPRYTFLFHQVAAGEKRVVITGYGTLVVHPKARLGATKNMGEEGSYPLNRAWRSRFSWLRLQPAKDITDILMSNVAGLDHSQAETLNSVYEKLLLAIEKHELDPKVMTIRGFVDAAKRMVRGKDRDHALTIGILNAIENPRWAEKVSAIIFRTA
jgi:MoxR-like ATPases